MYRMALALSTLCSRPTTYTPCAQVERSVKLLAVSSLGRIVVYSELQSSDDRVEVSVQQLMLCVCAYIRRSGGS